MGGLFVSVSVIFKLGVGIRCQNATSGQIGIITRWALSLLRAYRGDVSLPPSFTAIADGDHKIDYILVYLII